MEKKQPTDDYHHDPDARSSGLPRDENGIQLLVQDNSRDATFEDLPSYERQEAPPQPAALRIPLEPVVPEVSRGDESTLEYRDPDETAPYYGNYSGIADWLRLKREHSLFRTDAYTNPYSDYHKAVQEMEKEYFAAERAVSAPRMQQREHKLPWTKSEANFSISGPWLEPKCFYMDVRTGVYHSGELSHNG